MRIIVRWFLLLSALIFCSIPKVGYTESSVFPDFAQLLQSYVHVTKLPSGGIRSTFDYVAASHNPATARLISRQQQRLTKFDPTTLSTKNRALAFWINTYNFFMVTTILERGFHGKKLVIHGVKDLGSVLNPYSVFLQRRYKVGGRSYSLDDIEKAILLGDDYRKKGWKDARIHFALNCASKGCPPLRPQVYEAKTLDTALTRNIRSALKDPQQLLIQKNVLYLTSLFKWYANDFKESAGSVRDFILLYLDNPQQRQGVSQAKSIRYIPYDWRLNISPEHL